MSSRHALHCGKKGLHFKCRPAHSKHLKKVLLVKETKKAAYLVREWPKTMFSKIPHTQPTAQSVLESVGACTRDKRNRVGMKEEGGSQEVPAGTVVTEVITVM